MHTQRFLKAVLPNPFNIFAWFNCLLMLSGIYILDWNASSVIFVYFFETIIVGLIHVVKMLTVLKYSPLQKEEKPTPDGGALNGGGAIPFFVIHYFFFVFIQSIFIFTFFKSTDPGIKDGFNVISNYRHLFSKHDLQLAFGILVLSNIAFELKSFFFSARYKEYTVSKLFFQPYIRIFIQQFTTILSGFIFIFSGGATGAAILLIFIRLAVDLLLIAGRNSPALKKLLVKKLNVKKGEEEQTKKQVDSFLDS